MRAAFGRKRCAWAGMLCALAAVVACKGSTLIPNGPIITSSLTDTTGALLTVTKPKPERGDEKAGQLPHPDTLGGPYGHGKQGTYRPNDPTLAAPQILDTLVPDGVLAAYLDTLVFDKARDNGELALAPCKTGGPTCAVRLYIQPEIGMRHRGYSDVPPTGIVVVRIINYSVADTEKTFGIPPLTRAYWYVYPSGATLRSRVFMRTPLAARKLKYLGADTTYSDCAHTNGGGPALAKFRNCVDIERLGSRGGGDAVIGRVTNPFVRPVSFGPPSIPRIDAEPLTATELWVKCAQGCCVSGTAAPASF